MCIMFKIYSQVVVNQMLLSNTMTCCMCRRMFRLYASDFVCRIVFSLAFYLFVVYWLSHHHKCLACGNSTRILIFTRASSIAARHIIWVGSVLVENARHICMSYSTFSKKKNSPRCCHSSNLWFIPLLVPSMPRTTHSAQCIESLI